MSARFRKKPINISAVQWTGDNLDEVWDFTTAEYVYGPYDDNPAQLWIAANNVWADLEVGEWIIQDRLGFYPCKQSVFAETYEAVEMEDGLPREPTKPCTETVNQTDAGYYETAWSIALDRLGPTVEEWELPFNSVDPNDVEGVDAEMDNVIELLCRLTKARQSTPNHSPLPTKDSSGSDYDLS